MEELILEQKDQVLEQHKQVFEQNEQVVKQNDHVVEMLKVDFDNCGTVEENDSLEKLYPTLGIWAESIQNNEAWDLLTKCQFSECLLVEELKSLSEEQVCSYFTFGVGCLLNFVQANFTGPDLLPELVDYLTGRKFVTIDFVKMLSLISNQDINVNVKFPCLLIAARLTIECCKLFPVLNVWWKSRVIMIHQKILEESSPTLRTMAKLSATETNLLRNDKMKVKFDHTNFQIERGQLYLMYGDLNNGEAYLKAVRSYLGLNCELVGRLGKRTKFQREDIAQLSLKVESKPFFNIERSMVPKLTVPIDRALEDDTRLHTIEFAAELEVLKLTNSEQKLILALINQMLISKPHDNLFYEEIKPYIDVILSQNNTWAVRSASLILRSRLEAKHRRTIERSMLQIEEVLNAVKRKDPHPMTRVSGVFATMMDPIWKTEILHANMMIEIGLVKAALDIFLRLQSWENVIRCYTLLRMKHKAAEIIQQELEKNPTDELWCLLGDATNDATCYQKAWELSSEKSYRALRHWGYHFYHQGDYESCMDHLNRSLVLNPLQPQVWHRLAYAAFESKQWSRAATAYREFLNQEPDSFEAWNNLAQVYIKMRKPDAAHHALLEASRCNFEEWKVWENLLVVSSDSRHPNDVIRAYHRLLDMKVKYLNVGVLRKLVSAIVNDETDHEGKPCRDAYMEKARVLLGRVSQLYRSDGELWELYADLAPEQYVRAQRLQQAYKCYANQPKWYASPRITYRVLLNLTSWADVMLCDEINAKDALLYSTRLSLNSVVSALSKYSHENCDALKVRAAQQLDKINDKIKSGQAKSEESSSLSGNSSST